MKYFVSYTSRDKEITSAFLNNYFHILRKDGDVFIDIIHNDSLNKQERVFNELDMCDIFILIESENVYKSEWVLLEIERASKLKKKIIKISLESLKESLAIRQLSATAIMDCRGIVE
ncbi:toll/interleukin-1 receptor domain-containing protein [Chryseobacterium sp. LC2016-27]|uniref:TIR domain-containing protein n=1 Tax=Chryseobacterium sp. LC2016-27 TaxID=2897326 RepID=UPI001E532023|nr:TIR domain-containing protein [Chryseobacterium sp. LC2016-27]MCD0457173.1 toll/interleukin-1 receptor domain-containing protein [Chryseobacterium sp. LC2016-27]